MHPPFINRVQELEELASIANRGFYPVMYLYGPEGCGKTRLLKEFLHRLKGDEYLVVYIDAQSMHRVEDALWTSEKRLLDLFTEIVHGIAGPVGKALAIAITTIVKRVEKLLLKDKRVVIVVDDVARPLGLDTIELYTKNLLSLLEELYSVGARSVAIIATTSEGISRRLIARHSYARLFELWNLGPEAVRELLELLGAPPTLWDTVWSVTGGNPRSIVELWSLQWNLDKWKQGIARSIYALMDSLIPMYRRELSDVVDDIDNLIEYPQLREKLLEFNLVIPIDRPCLGYTPPIDKELGIGKLYAWQIPMYKIVIKEFISSNL